ncbi:hypothetical protein VTH82DRAFT_785 [Thermothelomyces myriococcoides]
MSSDVFRRVGRGGAGNFYSKQDIQAVEKGPETDLEAQSQQHADLSLAQTRTTRTGCGTDTGPNYARTGRGGAGNFTSPVAADANAKQRGDQERAEADQTEKASAAAVTASLAAKSTAGGLSGRGGAGNWRAGSGDGGGRGVQEDARKTVEELEKRVLDEVAGGLPPPAKAYTPSRR